MLRRASSHQLAAVGRLFWWSASEPPKPPAPLSRPPPKGPPPTLPRRAPVGPAPPPRAPIEGVKHVIVVASGKGGVGKSTTAANLAVALAKSGERHIGLLDADVFGPSLPRLMNLASSGRPRVLPDGKMVPLQAFSVRCMSMGFLLADDQAAVWRGPMVMGALEKLLRGTQWAGPPGAPPLDVLVVDMPPGTGDAHLSMSQKTTLAGSVIVSTPQDLALADARRGVAMYAAVGVPSLGLVENMAHHECAACGHVDHIFGQGGARRLATELGIEFLGEVPLLTTVRTASDAGTPVVLSAPDGAAARAYTAIAERVWSKLQAIDRPS